MTMALEMRQRGGPSAMPLLAAAVAVTVLVSMPSPSQGQGTGVTSRCGRCGCHAILPEIRCRHQSRHPALVTHFRTNIREPHQLTPYRRHTQSQFDLPCACTSAIPTGCRYTGYKCQGLQGGDTPCVCTKQCGGGTQLMYKYLVAQTDPAVDCPPVVADYDIPCNTASCNTPATPSTTTTTTTRTTTTSSTSVEAKTSSLPSVGLIALIGESK